VKDFRCPHCSTFITAALSAHIKKIRQSMPEEKSLLYGEIIGMMNEHMTVMDAYELAKKVKYISTDALRMAIGKWRNEIEHYRGNTRILCWMMDEEEKARDKCQESDIPVIGSQKLRSLVE